MQNLPNELEKGGNKSLEKNVAKIIKFLGDLVLDWLVSSVWFNVACPVNDQEN